MRLDPRTKLLILAVTSVSVFMNKSIAVECVFAGIPLVLLSVSGNLKRMLKYAAFFLALLLIQLFIVPRLPVTFGGIVYMFAVYIRKLLPCFMLGSFLIATTSVSKFLAAITKLRLSKGLTIALAITLRYFPTMREEWASIRDAMALRGIYRRWSMSMFPCLFLLPEFRTRLRRQRLQEASSTQVKEAV